MTFGHYGCGRRAAALALGGLLVLAGVCLVVACPSPGPSPGASKPRRTGDHWEQRGRAAWYGGKFHGRKTASGERFDQNAMTAAHRTLPFGTVVRVTNLNNRRSVTVRVNDRGPYKKSRIIDLSRAAAGKLGMIQSGVVPVKVTVVKRPRRGKRSKKRNRKRR